MRGPTHSFARETRVPTAHHLLTRTCFPRLQGLSAPIFGAAVENASLFFIYNRIQGTILAARGAGANFDKAEATIGELAVSAAGAGAVSSFLL